MLYVRGVCEGSRFLPLLSFFLLKAYVVKKNSREAGNARRNQKTTEIIAIMFSLIIHFFKKKTLDKRGRTCEE